MNLQTNEYYRIHEIEKRWENIVEVCQGLGNLRRRVENAEVSEEDAQAEFAELEEEMIYDCRMNDAQWAAFRQCGVEIRKISKLLPQPEQEWYFFSVSSVFGEQPRQIHRNEIRHKAEKEGVSFDEALSRIEEHFVDVVAHLGFSGTEDEKCL